VLDKLTRYEGHLARQLGQALQLLERLREARIGNPPPPPTVLDVTVDTGDSAGRPKALPGRS